MSNTPTHYTLSAQLVQGIVNTLNQLPAGQVRGLLNELERECVLQEKKAGDGGAKRGPKPKAPTEGPAEAA